MVDLWVAMLGGRWVVMMVDCSVWTLVEMTVVMWVEKLVGC